MVMEHTLLFLSICLDYLLVCIFRFIILRCRICLCYNHANKPSGRRPSNLNQHEVLSFMDQFRPVKKYLGILCAVFVVLLGFPVQAAWSAVFTIDEHAIRVELAADGSALVTETIHYRMLSDIQELEFQLLHDHGDPVQLVSIGVADMTSNTGQQIFVEAKQVEVSNSQKLPLTYTAKVEPDHLDIHLSTLSKAQSVRTVSLTYKLGHATEQHDGAALFERRFFSQNFKTNTQHLILDLVLPDQLPVERIWAKTASQSDFVTTQPGTSQLRFQATDLSADQDLTLTCVMPADFFSTSLIAEHPLTWEQLIDRARAADNWLNWLRSLRQSAAGLVFMLITLAALLGAGIYWFFDREGAAEYRQRYDREIVEYLPPAVIARLLRQNRPARLILATLLDLVRRKELALDGCVFTQLHQERTDYTGFSASEVYLLQWMFGQIARENTLSTAQIRQYARGEDTAGRFRAYYRQYRVLFDEELRSRDLFDQNRTIRGRIMAVAIAGIYLILAVVFILPLQAPAGWLLLLPSFLLLLYSRQINRLTQNGRELKARCQSLRRYLLQMTRQKPLAGPDFLARILPVSIALGSSQNLFRQIGRTWSQVGPEQLGISGLADRSKKRSTTEQLQDFIIDLQVMESMLSASLLLAEGVHL